MTYQELINAQQACAKLIQVKLPIKVSLDIAKLVIQIEQPIKVFAMARDKLMQNYKIKAVPVGGSTEILKFKCTDRQKDLDALFDVSRKAYSELSKAEEIQAMQRENEAKFAKDFSELLESETECTFKKVKIPAEIDGKSVQIEPAVLIPLIDFVEV